MVDGGGGREEQMTLENMFDDDAAIRCVLTRADVMCTTGHSLLEIWVSLEVLGTA